VNCPKCYAVLQAPDWFKPVCKCGWNMAEELEREDFFQDMKVAEVKRLLRAVYATISGERHFEGVYPAAVGLDELEEAFEPFEGKS
jgi:hypothetical protein